MSKVLVTGGAGFIGSHLVDELLKLGHEVVVIDNLTTGKEDNISHIRSEIEFIKGDIRDSETIKKCLDGVEYVFHLAALPSVFRSIDDPLTSNDMNINGTLNLLIASGDAGVKGFIYSSSSSVYAGIDEIPKREDMCPKPLSPYGITKLTGELYCKIFSDLYGLKTVSLRYFNIFGPRQNPDSEYAAVIPKFIKLMLLGKRPTIYGDGNQTRDFTFVKDAVKANILSMNAKVSGETFNIACGNQTSLNELVKKINSYLGTDIEPIYEDPRPGDARYSQADISKASKFLNYKPSYTFDEGLRLTIEWFRRKYGLKKD